MRKFLLLLPLLFFCSSRPAAAQTFIQGTSHQCTGGSLASCVLTFGSAIGSGHFIVGACGPYQSTTNANTSGVTDSAGSTYTVGTRTSDTQSGMIVTNIQPFYTLSSGGGAGTTVTCSYSPNFTGGFIFVTAAEYSSPPTSLDVTSLGDQYSFPALGGQTPITQNLTPSFTHEFLIGLAEGFAGSATCTGGSDGQSGTYMMRAGGASGGSNFIYLEEIAEATIAAYKSAYTSCTQTGGSNAWSAYTLAFKTSASTSSVVTQIGGFLVGP